MKRLMMIPFLVMLLGAAPDSTRVDKPDTIKTEKATVNEDEIIGKIKTVYDVGGRPVNQSVQSRGYHRVTDKAVLKNGIDTIEINTSTADGRQNIGFIGDSTYSGRAWSLNPGNQNHYWLVPIGGNKFIIMSSDSTDNSTVRFQVEGE